MPVKTRLTIGGFFLFIPSVLFLHLYISHPEQQPEIRLVENKAISVGDYLKQLNALTPIEITYQPEVERYINLYLGERKESLKSMLSNSEIYFPLIEAELDKHNLPLELKYLAALESGLNPLAKSSSGAVGLWQFLYNTTSLLDLEVNSYIDERRDPYKSTEAACKYLKYLYNTYNDWNLALAAYNGGPGEVRKAIQRSGGKTNYWEIRPYLSKQAASYVPAFIAFNYLFERAEELGIEFQEPELNFENIDTIQLQSDTYLSIIANQIEIEEDKLVLLNPIFTKNYVPEKSVLVLPKDKITIFIKKEDKIYNQRPCKMTYNQVKAEAGNTKGLICKNYIVKKGDFFHKLALNHNCTVENIKAWNKLENNKLYPGQKLKIWVRP